MRMERNTIFSNFFSIRFRKLNKFSFCPLPKRKLGSKEYSIVNISSLNAPWRKINGKHKSKCLQQNTIKFVPSRSSLQN